jgi:hypothetical protein
MPAKRKNERIAGTYFVWLLGQRDGVYYADGRSNRPSAGRHSLGTRNYAEAVEALKQLDLVQAVALGRADGSLLAPQASTQPGRGAAAVPGACDASAGGRRRPAGLGQALPAGV